MAANLNFVGENQTTAAEQIIKLYNLFIAVDATQVKKKIKLISQVFFSNLHHNLGRN